MKIMLATSCLLQNSGAEKSLIDLANYLSNNKHEVIIFTLYGNRISKNQLLFQINDNIDLISLGDIRIIDKSKGNKNYIYKIFQITKTLYYKKKRSIGKLLFTYYGCPIFYYWSVIRKISIIKYWVKHNKPDVIIAFRPSSFKIISYIGESLSIPVIVSNRSDPYNSDWAYFNQDRKLNRVIRYSVSISKANVVLHKNFINYFCISDRKKTFVIGNPVYLPNKKYYARPEIECDRNIIISVGRMTWDKNHKIIINSFRYLSSKYPNWVVKIYGSPDERDDLEKIIITNSLEDRVFLFDPIPNISSELSKSHIFAFPSLSDGFSRALTEAMAHRLPSVVINTCTVPVELISNSNGGLVAKNDEVDFAKKLETLILYPHLRKDFGNNASSYIKRYDPEGIYKKWEHLIDNVVNS